MAANTTDVHPNTKKFRALLTAHNLDLQAAAKIIRRSYQRVKDLHSGKYHTISDEMLELLEFRLQQLSGKEKS